MNGSKLGKEIGTTEAKYLCEFRRAHNYGMDARLKAISRFYVLTMQAVEDGSASDFQKAYLEAFDEYCNTFILEVADRRARARHLVQQQQ